MTDNDDFDIKRPPRFIELDPENWEHQELARALKVQRDGALCRHGHRWLETGVLCVDGRMRCRACAVDYCRKRRKRTKTMKTLTNGGE